MSHREDTSNDTAQEKPARKAGRPSTVLLTRERILSTAFDLADRRDGNFSVTAIARALGVQPPAIYNYFNSKAAIIAGMRGELARRIDTSVFEQLPWYEAVIPWAHSYLEAMGQHPGIIATLATIPVDSEPESLLEYERIVRCFQRSGYPTDRIVPALVAIESFIIGSALDALTPEDNLRPGRAPERAPALLHTEQAARDAAAASGIPMARSIFEFGLTALVTGLRAAASTKATTL